MNGHYTLDQLRDILNAFPPDEIIDAIPGGRKIKFCILPELRKRAVGIRHLACVATDIYRYVALWNFTWI